MSDTDGQLIAAIERHEGSADTQVNEDRAELLQLYRGEDIYGHEEGRSAFVSRDCYDVVETVKPQLLKLFLSGDEVVRFDPVGPEDIGQAKLESEYINSVTLNDNAAFPVFADWLHDGLVQRNGYVLVHWDEHEESDTETYRGLSDDEFAMLMQDPAVSASAHSASVDVYGQTVHDVELERVTVCSGIKLINVAPENVVVSVNHDKVSLAQVEFVERVERKTLSQLREEGFDVDDDLSDGGDGRNDWEADTRDADRWGREDVQADPSMRRVKVRECWIRTALESGEQTAELRHVILVGTTILLNESADLVPLIAWCPKPQPHMHVGMSLTDEVEDIQAVKTASTRGLLDGMYLSLNGRFAVDEDRVNFDDMLVSRPGGIVRTQGTPMDAFRELVNPNTQGIGMQALEYFDQVKEQRTGLTRYTSGLDPNSLNKTATGIMQLQAASMQRIELIGRHFAEAVKELFWTVHALTLKHGRKMEMVRLSNEWVPIDPRSWKKRKDLSISVGLGTGNRQEQSGFLSQMLQIAFGPGLQMGLTDPSKVYQMLSRLTNNAGFKAPEEFWSDPKGQPNPMMQQQQQMQQMLQQLQQENAALKADKQIEVAKVQLDAQEVRSDADAESAKLAQAQQEAVLRAEVELQKAQLQADTQLRIARMNAITSRQSAAATRLASVKVKRDGLQ